jgi:hypothetical protein
MGDLDGSGATDLADLALLQANLSAPSVVTSHLRGDFDGDQRVTTADIDLLLVALAAGENDSSHDLTGDGQVSRSDLDVIVQQLVETPVGPGTRYGDLNLDGHVDRRDAAQMARYFGRSSSPSWATGDFDGSGATDLADLAMLQANLDVSAASPLGPAAADALVVAVELKSGSVSNRGFAAERPRNAGSGQVAVHAFRRSASPTNGATADQSSDPHGGLLTAKRDRTAVRRDMPLPVTGVDGAIGDTSFLTDLMPPHSYRQLSRFPSKRGLPSLELA